MEEAEYRHNHSCTVCRRKKVRCDGLKPTCSSCQHAGFPEDCEYITHRSISQDELLEEQIRVLHLRIHQLENPQVHDTLVLLHRPYAPHAPLPSPSIVPETSYETFLSNPGDTPFFFDSDTLRSFLSNATNRSSPSCMYLLAAMSITQASKTTKNLNHKPRAALGLRGDALQDKEHMSKLFTIQAELLMACHFMRFGQLLEARFHSCSAIALALFLNLHKFNYATESSMLEVKQHISAFWFICRNDWLLAIMQNTKTNLPLSIHSATPAMPWPSDFRSEDVQPFRPVMSEWLDEPHSIERYPTSLNALNVRATILWYSAHELILDGTSSPTHSPLSPLVYGKFSDLVRMSDALQSVLQSQSKTEYFESRLMLHNARLLLYSIYSHVSDMASQRLHTAAHEIFTLIISIPLDIAAIPLFLGTMVERTMNMLAVNDIRQHRDELETLFAHIKQIQQLASQSAFDLPIARITSVLKEHLSVF